jgi:hypothetical protein
MSSPLRVEMLEQQAERQRSLLESHVSELRRSVKDRLDIKRNLSRHVWPLAGVVAVLGMALGYAVTGIFTRD